MGSMGSRTVTATAYDELLVAFRIRPVDYTSMCIALLPSSTERPVGIWCDRCECECTAQHDHGLVVKQFTAQSKIIGELRKFTHVNLPNSPIILDLAEVVTIRHLIRSNPGVHI